MLYFFQFVKNLNPKFHSSEKFFFLLHLLISQFRFITWARVLIQRFMMIYCWNVICAVGYEICNLPIIECVFGRSRSRAWQIGNEGILTIGFPREIHRNGSPLINWNFNYSQREFRAPCAFPIKHTFFKSHNFHYQC